MRRPLLRLTAKGLYCPTGDFYVDPSRGVDRAVITHAHSDHARRGAREYICTKSSVCLMKARLGAGINVRGVPYGETFTLGGVKLSFHSAGHILGSAQVRLEVPGEVWCVSGDYKREADPSCEPFEVVRCDTFVTEATFGTPSFAWKRTVPIGEEINAWWAQNRSEGFNSLALGYSLGKSQRLLAEISPFVKGEPVWIHPTLAQITECYRNEGIRLAPTEVLTLERMPGVKLEGALLIAPLQIDGTEWTQGVEPYRAAFASGWSSGNSRFHAPERDGFVVSDHADWGDLLRTIAETGARRVYVQHRGTGALVRHLRKLKIEAYSDEALRAESAGDDGQMPLL